MRRFISVILTVMLTVTALSAVSVFAADTPYYGIENFEAYKGSDLTSFPPTGYAGTFHHDKTFPTTITSDGGKDGSSAMILEGQVGAGSKSVNLATHAVPLAGKGYISSFDIKFLQLPDHPELVRNGGGVYGSENLSKRIKLFAMSDSGAALGTIEYIDSLGALAFDLWGTRQVIETDVWYKLVFMVSPGANDSTTNLPKSYTRQIFLYQNGTLLKKVSTSMEKKYGEGGQYYPKAGFWVYPMMIPNLTEWTPTGGETITPTQHIKAVVDNLENYSYDPLGNAAPVLLNSSVTNGMTDVARNSTFSFAFDRAISGAPKLYDEAGTEVTVGSGAIKTEYNRVSLSLASMLLDKKKNYELRFDSVLDDDSDASAAPAISFTTEELHMLPDVVISDVTPGSTDTTVTFSVDEPLDYSSVAVKAIAAVYKNDQLIGFDIKSVTVADNTAQTVSFALGDLTAQSNYKVAVMLCDEDVSGNIAPVSSGTFTVS